MKFIVMLQKVSYSNLVLRMAEREILLEMLSLDFQNSEIAYNVAVELILENSLQHQLCDLLKALLSRKEIEVLYSIITELLE